jgi:hypothetical protein
MKKFARALALVTGLALLAGCDAVTQNWLPIATDHRPEVKTSSVSGFVEDSAGNIIPNAVVTNGASVAATDGNGFFTLTKIKVGYQSFTASYDGKTSPANMLTVKADSNPNITLKVPTVGPVSDNFQAVKLGNLSPLTLTASYSIATTSISPVIPVPQETRYPTGKDLTLQLSSPPNGAGVTIKSYKVVYDDNAAPARSESFWPEVVVEPGGDFESGPIKHVLLKNVGPSSAAFSTYMEASRSVRATISLYTELTPQDATTSVALHAPKKGKPDESRALEVQISIQKAE